MKQKINIIAFGCTGILLKSIKYLSENGFKIIAIITDPVATPTGVTHELFRDIANKIQAEFLITKKLSDPKIKELIMDNNVFAAISANWKYTVPEDFLSLFDGRALNFHIGNLPDYKGNATINWSIINGENYITCNIHKMAKELDTGDIIVRKKIKIDANTYVGEIVNGAEDIAPLLFSSALNKLIKNPEVYLIKGSSKGLYCYPRLPEDSQINWTDSIENVHRLVRASAHPYNGAFSYFKGEKVIIWKANCIKPKEKFLAIPGHIIKIQKNKKTILVACADGFLEILEIEIGGEIKSPISVCKSIRERFKYLNNAYL